MTAAIRYATAPDGVKIAYQVVGTDRSTWSLCRGWVSHLELAWRSRRRPAAASGSPPSPGPSSSTSAAPASPNRVPNTNPPTLETADGSTSVPCWTPPALRVPPCSASPRAAPLSSCSRRPTRVGPPPWSCWAGSRASWRDATSREATAGGAASPHCSTRSLATGVGRSASRRLAPRRADDERFRRALGPLPAHGRQPRPPSWRWRP